MARPKKPPGEARGLILRIRVNESELKRIDAAAAADGHETSTWARELLLAASTNRAGTPKKKRLPLQPPEA